MATKRRKPRSRRNLGRRIGCAHNGCANVQGTKSSWKFALWHRLDAQVKAYCKTNGTAKIDRLPANRQTVDELCSEGQGAFESLHISFARGVRQGVVVVRAPARARRVRAE